MSKVFLSVLMFSFVASTKARAAEEFVETISLSTSAAVAASKMAYGTTYALSCDGTIFYKTCSSSTCTATSSDVKVANFDVPFDIPMPLPYQWVSLIRSGGSTVTCQIFKVLSLTPGRK